MKNMAGMGKVKSDPKESAQAAYAKSNGVRIQKAGAMMGVSTKPGPKMSNALMGGKGKKS